LDNLSKIELGAVAWNPDRDLIVSVRERLDGDDLSEAKIMMKETGWDTAWISFDFPGISLTPGNTYYIVCRSSAGGWGTGWAAGSENPYENGGFYTSSDAGKNWENWNDIVDGCFVTYG
jgi:hypothetical protein